MNLRDIHCDECGSQYHIRKNRYDSLYAACECGRAPIRAARQLPGEPA